MNARRTLMRNATFGLAGQVVPLVVGIATIPATISALGTERFGMLAIAWAILVYFGLFDLGLGRATTRFVARAIGEGSEASIPEVVWTAVAFQSAFGLVGLVGMETLAPQIADIFQSAPSVAAEAEQMFRVLAFVVPVLLVSVCFRGVLEAGQRFDLVAAVRSPLNSSMYILTFLGANLGFGLLGIVSLLWVAYSVALIAYYLLARRVFPSLRGRPTWAPRNLGPLLRFGGWVTASMVLGPLLLSLDRVLIGALVSVSAVTFYAAPYEAIYRFVLIPASLGAALFPTVSTLKSRQDVPSIRDLTLRSIEVVVLLLGPILLTVIVLAPDLLRLWLGVAFAEKSTPALQLLAAGVLFNGVAQMPFSVIQGLGRPDLTAKFHTLELPVHIVLLFTLVPQWGITGGAAAWVARAGIDATLVWLAAARLLSLPRRALLTRRIRHIALLLSVASVVMVALAMYVDSPWQRGLLLVTLFVAVQAVAWRLVAGKLGPQQLVALLRRAPAT